MPAVQESAAAVDAGPRPASRDRPHVESGSLAGAAAWASPAASTRPTSITALAEAPRARPPRSQTRRGRYSPRITQMPETPGSRPNPYWSGCPSRTACCTTDSAASRPAYRCRSSIAFGNQGMKQCWPTLNLKSPSCEHLSHRLVQYRLALRGRKRYRRLVAALPVCLLRGQVSRSVVAIAGHANEIILALLLSLQLILDEWLTRQVQHRGGAKVEARHRNRHIESLQPGQGR